MSQHSSSGPEWDALRLRVLDRDGWMCSYCGKHLEGRDATADHLLAKANGGEDTMTNLIAACRSCNGTKGANELVRVSGFNPRWLDHL